MRWKVALLVLLPGLSGCWQFGSKPPLPVWAAGDMVQLTGPVPEHEPVLGVAETKVAGPEKVSMMTGVAADGPLFVTVIT